MFVMRLLIRRDAQTPTSTVCASRLACYLSDDGASMLMFDCLAEAAGFARIWVPFCKRHNIEPRSPEAYFAHTIDFLKDKVQPDFGEDEEEGQGAEQARSKRK